jgi:hypothetical protein
MLDGLTAAHTKWGHHCHVIAILFSRRRFVHHAHVSPQAMAHVKRLRVEIECANEVVFEKGGGAAFGDPGPTISIYPPCSGKAPRVNPWLQELNRSARLPARALVCICVELRWCFWSWPSNTPPCHAPQGPSYLGNISTGYGGGVSAIPISLRSLLLLGNSEI